MHVPLCQQQLGPACMVSPATGRAVMHAGGYQGCVAALQWTTCNKPARLQLLQGALMDLLTHAIEIGSHAGKLDKAAEGYGSRVYRP